MIQNRLLGWGILAREWEHKLEHYHTTRTSFQMEGKVEGNTLCAGNRPAEG